jgi:tRNA threonylcarbamoyladenosine modification (KEOPS) complex  Pcc1 subunit
MSSVVLTLQVDDKNVKQMYDSIMLDMYDKGRADVKVKLDEKKKELIFKISSEDFTSVRATINAVLLKLRMFNEIDIKFAQNKEEDI